MEITERNVSRSKTLREQAVAYQLAKVRLYLAEGSLLDRRGVLIESHLPSLLPSIR